MDLIDERATGAPQPTVADRGRRGDPRSHGDRHRHRRRCGTPAATTSLADDTGVLTIDVPVAWTAVSTTPTTDDAGVSHAQIAAATDLDGLYKTYATPGVIYAQHDYTADTASAITTAYDFSAECTASAVAPYSDGYFTGSRLDWTGCGGTQSRVVTVLANPLDRAFSALVLVQLPTPADDPALDVVLGSFYVANPTSTALHDDTGSLAMSVPAAWTQVVTTPVTDAATGTSAPSIVASAPAAAGVPTPMVSFTTIPRTDDLDGALAGLAATAAGCTPGAPQPYADGYFTGQREDLTELSRRTADHRRRRQQRRPGGRDGTDDRGHRADRRRGPEHRARLVLLHHTGRLDDHDHRRRRTDHRAPPRRSPRRPPRSSPRRPPPSPPHPPRPPPPPCRPGGSS